MATNQIEQELPEVVLVSEEEKAVRGLYNEFYTHLRIHSPNSEAQGPGILTDSSFDRMMHERIVTGFIVGKVAAEGALDEVLQDARLREGRTISEEELPHMIVSSLASVRKSGEWDSESRPTRRQLLTKGMSDHVRYPLISAALSLGDMLKYDGHEVYAQDAVVAVTKWLERVDRKKQALISAQTGNPAA